MLIIYLSPLAQGQLDYVISSDGMRVNQVSSTEAHRLPAGHGETVVLLPWQVLSWHTVQLPPAVGSRKQAVLHSLLEDELLQDPQDALMVCAPGHAAALRQGGEVQVAVCDKRWLRQALAPLQAAGIAVHRLLPEFQPVKPNAAAKLYLLNELGANRALLCDAHSVWLLPSPEAVALKQANDIQVLADPLMTEHSTRWHAQTPQLQSTAERWLLATHTDWDMAQDEWASNRRARGWRWLQQAGRHFWSAPHWRSCRRSLLALSLVQLVGLNVWAWQTQLHRENQQRLLTQLFLESFPHSKVVIDPALQMQRELQQLRQQSGQLSAGDLEQMLSQLAATWPTQAVPDRIDYQKGELRISGLSEDSLQQLKQQAWKDKGFDWQMQEQTAVWRQGKAP
jgi:general secretion pathway protein L